MLLKQGELHFGEVRLRLRIHGGFVEQIEISRLTQQDYEDVVEMLQDEDVMRFIGPWRPLTDKEADEWFREALEQPSRFPFRMTESGELIGFCGLKRMGETLDFDYHLRH